MNVLYTVRVSSQHDHLTREEAVAVTTRTKCPTRDDEVVVVAPVAVVPIKEGVVVEGATGGGSGRDPGR